MIASTAAAESNRLDTNTLTHGDLQNSSNWEVSATSAGLGLNTGPTVNILNPTGINPSLPVHYEDGNSQQGSTQSAVAAGTVTVRQDASTGQNSTAGLSRDTQHANDGSLVNDFDLTAANEGVELSRAQADIASTLAPYAFKAVGDLSAKYGWAEGGPEKVALHAFTGALIVAIAGGDALAGAGVGAANEWLVGQVNDYIQAQQPPLSKDQQAAIALGASAVLGAILDGTQGAALALAATQNNYLSHRDVQELDQRLKRCGNDTQCIEDAREWMRQRDAKNSAAQAACATDECRLSHAVAMEAGNQALRNPEINAYLSVSPGLRGEIELRQSGDKVQLPSSMKALAVVAGFAIANCGGAWDASCKRQWDAGQEKQSQEAKALVAAIYAPAVVATGTEAIITLRSCLASPVCINELGVGAADVLIGDATGGAGLGVGAGASAKVGASVVGNIDAQASKMADEAVKAAVSLVDDVSIKAAQISLNRKNGVEFEKQVIEAFEHVGGVKNTEAVTVQLPNGTQVTTIPDLWGRNVGGLLEVKNVKELSMSDQLRAQIKVAQDSGQPFNLVVSPKTISVSEKLISEVRKTGGNVYVYNPALGYLRDF